MRITLVSTLLLSTKLALAATAVDGWYTSVFGGYAYLPTNLNVSTPSGLIDRTDYKGGYNAGGRIGFQSNPIRYEGEYTYINGNLNYFNLNQIQQMGVVGNSVANLVMANIYYDTTEFLPALTSFLGIGIGYAYLSTDLTSSDSFGNPIFHFQATDNAFAYQATAGLTYNFSENYALNLAYRYVGTTTGDNFGKVFQAQMVSGGAIYRFDYGNYK